MAIKIYGMVLFASVLGFTVTVLLVGPVRRLAFLLGAVDKPDGVRKLHRRATPTLGGLALAGGLFFSIGMQALYSRGHFEVFFVDRGNDEVLNRTFMLGLALSTLMIVVLGLIDDVRALKPRVKLIGQIAAACVLYFVGRLSIPTVLGIPTGWLAFPLTVLWLIACTNAVNLIDGLDGLASGVSLIASITVLVFSVVQGNAILTLLSATLCGCIAGVLIFNWPPATIFLGDCGSLFLGFMIGALSIKGSLKSHATFAFVAAVLPLGLPMMDSVFAAARRWAVGLPISRADRQHVHHRLSDWGLSHKEILVLLYAVCAIFGALAFIISMLQWIWAALVLVVAGGVSLAVARFLWRREADRFTRRVRGLFQLRADMRDHSRAVREFLERLEGITSCPELRQVLDQAGTAAGVSRLDIALSEEYAIDGKHGISWGSADLQPMEETGRVVYQAVHELPLLHDGRHLGKMNVSIRYEAEEMGPDVAGTAQEIAAVVAEKIDRLCRRSPEAMDGPEEKGLSAS